MFQQQDVQELTRVLFDALEETFKGTPVENIIDDLYAGELIDYLRCLDVDYESERVDKFLDFSLAIVPFGSDKPMCNLTECIEMFLRPEILDGENKYHVEKFDRKVDAIKGLKFGKLPKIMSVQLKRFVYDFSGPSIVQKKLNDVVKFPMILDMNKYVAKRVTAGSSTAKKTSEVVEEDDEDHMNLRESNEFEVFLREQMDLLKSGRLADAEQESSPCAPAAVPQLISEPPDYYDEIPHSCFECADSTATTAFAVATAAEEEVHGKNKEEGTEREETVVYDSMSTEQLEALITERGEWVYELYAVLIHSGVINGGHYYAYIKDLGTKRWWNFNDSTVTPMDEKAVQEAWGCEYTSSAAFNYPTPLYGRPLSVSGKSLSSSNAYMLMYRKATQLSAPSAEQNPSSSACEEATATPVASAAPRAVLSVCPVVTDEMVPAYIRELVQEETRLAEERLRLQAEERNRLSFKVYWQGVERTVRTTKSATYKQLLAQLWEEMEVKQHLGESLTHYLEKKQATQQSSSDSVELAEVCVDVASHGESSMQDDCSPAPLPAIDTEAPTVAAEDPLDGPCFDLFRLRNYNSFTHTKSDTYDYHSSGHLTLDALNFRDFRAYVLETRSGEDEWEQYFVDGLTLNIFEVDNNDEAASVTGTCTFKEPRSLRVQRSTTLGQLRLAISKWTAYPVERVQVMKITNCGFNDGQLDLLTNDAASLRDDLCIYDGGKLYIEEKAPVCEDQGEAKQQFKAFEAFLNLRNRIDIRVNRPPEDSFGHTLTVDLRWAVQELRAFVAEKLDLVDQELRLFKQSATGQELRDGPQTLAQAGVYNSMGLAVRLGKATPLGYFNVQFVEFVAKNSIGVVELPELEPEYEIVELASGNQPGSLLDPIDFWKDSTIDSIDDSPPPLVTVPFDNLSSAALGQGRGRELGQGLRLRARGAGNVFDDYEESGTEKNSVASNEGVADLSDVPDLVDEEEFPADFATTDTDTAAAIAASATAVEAVPMDDANNLANFADFSSAPAVTAVPAAAVAVDCCTDPVMPPSSTQQTFPMKPLSLSVESLYAVPADSKQFMKSDAALGEEDIDIAPSDFGERMVWNIFSSF